MPDGHARLAHDSLAEARLRATGALGLHERAQHGVPSVRDPELLVDPIVKRDAAAVVGRHLPQGRCGSERVAFDLAEQLGEKRLLDDCRVRGSRRGRPRGLVHRIAMSELEDAGG